MSPAALSSQVNGGKLTRLVEQLTGQRYIAADVNELETAPSPASGRSTA